MKNRKQIIKLSILLIVLVVLLILLAKTFLPEPEIPEKVYVLPTSTPVPTETQAPTPTNTPEPEPTPTSTPEPEPTPTDIPEPTVIPTTSLEVIDSGKAMSPALIKLFIITGDVKQIKIKVLAVLISLVFCLLCFQIKKIFFTKEKEKEETKS